MKRLVLALIFTSIIAITQSTYASITVDGNLTNDWGVTPGAWGSSDWTPNDGIISSDLTNEDAKGGLGTYVGPGYGGQLFDAEAMYYKREESLMYLAIVTGHPQSGVRDSVGTMYYPGDIAFDFNGDGIYEYGLVTRGSNQGKLYSGLTASSWRKGAAAWGGVSDPTTIIITSGMTGNLCSFTYNNTYYSTLYDNNIDDDHWVMELAIPTSYFGSDWKNGGKVHWTQTCGNDEVNLYIPKTVPEPASVSLLGLGLAGLFRFRRKRS